MKAMPYHVIQMSANYEKKFCVTCCLSGALSRLGICNGELFKPNEEPSLCILALFERPRQLQSLTTNVRRHLTIPTSDLSEHHDVHARRPILKISRFLYFEEAKEYFLVYCRRLLYPLMKRHTSRSYFTVMHTLTHPIIFLSYRPLYGVPMVSLNYMCVLPVSPWPNEVSCLS